MTLKGLGMYSILLQILYEVGLVLYTGEADVYEHTYVRVLKEISLQDIHFTFS